MALVKIGSAGTNLPSAGNNSAIGSPIITLAAGQKYIIPAGQYYYKTGAYSNIEIFDPTTQTWVQYGEQTADGFMESDGVNFRLINRTGCAIGALVTTAGTGYLTVPTVTASSGTSTWRAILGGALNTTVTVATAGSGYVHPPTIVIAPPTSGGVAATVVAVVSAGAISSVSLTNVGAGYTSAPVAATTGITANGTILFGAQANTYQIIPDPADTITTPAVLTFSLNTGTATNVTAIVNTDPGVAITSVPTLTISAAPGGGTTAVATAIMQFTVTGLSFTSTQIGSGYGTALPVVAIAPGFNVAGTQANALPISGTGLFQTRAFQAYGTSLAAGTLVATGFTISDGGLHQGVPTAVAFIPAGTSVPTLLANGTVTVGGVSDTSFLQQI